METLRGNNTGNNFKIDSKYFRYASLETWATEAPWIVFTYHAFTLYAALLVDAQPTAESAITDCQLFRNSAKGAQKYGPSSADRPGILTSAHALYWEGIVLARKFESWSPPDSERYGFIIKVLESRAKYTPSTFQHKFLFLEGCNSAGSVSDDIS